MTRPKLFGLLNLHNHSKTLETANAPLALTADPSDTTIHADLKTYWVLLQCFWRFLLRSSCLNDIVWMLLKLASMCESIYLQYIFLRRSIKMLWVSNAREQVNSVYPLHCPNTSIFSASWKVVNLLSRLITSFSMPLTTLKKSISLDSSK